MMMVEGLGSKATGVRVSGMKLRVRASRSGSGVPVVGWRLSITAIVIKVR